jgi:hypothetical protein
MVSNQKPEPPSFWHSGQGLLTAIAALVTAVGGLVTALHSCSDDAAKRDLETVRIKAEQTERLAQQAISDAKVKEVALAKATEEAARLQHERDEAEHARKNAEERSQAAESARRVADEARRLADQASTPTAGNVAKAPLGGCRAFQCSGR